MLQEKIDLYKDYTDVEVVYKVIVKIFTAFEDENEANRLADADKEVQSLYEEQVDRLVKMSGFDENCKSTFKTIKLTENSVLIGKRVGDIFLPQAIDMSSIKRNGELIVSDSETRFLPNDEVTFICQINNKNDVDDFLNDIT